MKKLLLFLISFPISLISFSQTLTVTASLPTICKDEQSVLSANLAGCTNVLYSWQNPAVNSNTIIVSPTSTTQYDVTAYCLVGTELVTQGNFSGINMSSLPFISSYKVENPNSINGEGEFYIGVAPNIWNSGFNSINQHSTTGNNNDMMIINGSPKENQVVWQQSITGIVANKKYAFSIWVHSLNDLGNNYADLSFKIGSSEAASTIKGKSFADGWQQFFTIWTSGSSSTATISIINKNIIAEGNDFAIDDISFMEVNSYNGSVIVNLDLPSIGNITLDKEYLCNTEGERQSLIASCNNPLDGTWSITPLSVATISNPQAGTGSVPSTVVVSGVPGIIGSAILTYTTQPNSKGCVNSVSIPIDVRECCENPCYWNTLGNSNVKAYNFIGPINNEDFKIRTNNTERMIVKKDGKIGIGTSSPNALFHVSKENGSMGFPYEMAAFESSGDTKFGVYSSSSDEPDGTKGAALTFGYSNSTDADGNFPGYEMQFLGTELDKYYLRFNYIVRQGDGQVVAGDTENEGRFTIPNVLTLSNVGNVGVNTSLPTAKFHTKGNVRFEELGEGCGDMLVIDQYGYVHKKNGGCKASEKSTKVQELENKLTEQQKEIDILKTQVKALLEAKNYSTPYKTELPSSNILDIIPTPFSSNAKVVYELNSFNGDEQLQLVDISGKIIKSYKISQQKGQLEIGLVSSSSSTIYFNIVSRGSIIASKKSIKTNNY